MKTRQTLLLLGLFTLLAAANPLSAADKLKVLLVDGQNNHRWKDTTPVLKWILEASGRFTVDVSTTPPSAPRQPRAPKGALTPAQKAQHDAEVAKWKEQKGAFGQTKEDGWKSWRPKFKDYDVIVSNYNGESWPEEVRQAFVDYVRNGGGLVAVHAADNSFSDWPEYNEMIGVGGWGGRNEKSGPMIRFRDGKMVLDTSPASGGTHGKATEYVVEIREPGHPITQGLPSRWLHATDELYGRLRGPAKNLSVLATALSAKETGGTGEIEPILIALAYGKGRVFHDVLGHGPGSMEDIGFQVTLQRGTEWAATGKVTLPAPKAEDMPADKVAKREPPPSVTPK